MRSEKSILVCLFSHNVWGGIETWLREILAAHREAGWKVTIALARGKRFNDPARFLRALGERSAIEMDGRTGTTEGRIAAVQRVVERVSPSIVMPLGLGHALPAIGRAKARGTQTRLVHALHAINGRLLRDAEAFASITDLVVGVNPLQTRFLQRSIPAERLAVVPNGTWPPNVRRRKREANGPLQLVFAGRIDQGAKRVLDSIALSAELRRRGVPFRYTIAGDGPSLDALKQAGGLDLLGYVEPSRLRSEIYPASDVLTVFSEAGESFVLVAIDAMINGCVLVTSDWPGIRSAGYLNGFLFPPGDIVRAADHIESLWRNPDLLAAKSQESAEIASRFTWTRTRELWIAAMESLLHRSPVKVTSFPYCAPSGSGRLDRLSVRLAERIRHLLHRYPDFTDGWGEWPGTLSHVSPEEESAIFAELRQLDSV